MVVKIHRKDGSTVILSGSVQAKASASSNAVVITPSDGGALARKIKDALDRSDAALKATKPRRPSYR